MPEAIAILPALFGGAEAGAGGLLGGLGSLFGLGEAAAAPIEAGAFVLPEISVTAPAAAAGAAEAGAAGAGAAGLGTAGLTGGLVDFGLGAAEGAGPWALSEGAINAGGPIPASELGLAAPEVAKAGPFTSPTIGSPIGGGGAGPAGFAGPSGIDTLPTIGPGTQAPLSLTPGGVGGATPTAAGATADSGGVLGFLQKNPGLAAALGIGLAGNLAGGKLGSMFGGKPPGSDQLTQLAQQESVFGAQQSRLGTELTQPLLTGKLPAGQEQSVVNAVNDAIATTKARYASLGLSGSSMEADAVANIQNQATGIRAQIEQQMAQTGLSASQQAAGAFGLQGTVYSQLMQAQIAQDQALQNAIARFSSAAALGTGMASRPTA